MADDVYFTMADPQSCAAQGTKARHKESLRLFPSAVLLEFMAIDILGPLPATKSGNQHEIVLTNRYTKLTRTILVTKVISMGAAAVFLDNWVIPYGISTNLLTYNGLGFFLKFFAAVTALLGIKSLSAIAFHPQTNAQVERFNRTMVPRLGKYMAGHQYNWMQYGQPLM